MGPKDTSKYVIGNLRNFGRSPEKDKKAAGAEGAAPAANGGASSEHVEAVGKQTRWQKTKRHCGRFWICYAIGIVVFLAIFLPVFFLIAIPAIAQRMVEDADLPIHSAALFNPSPDQIDYGLTASIKVPDPFTVHLNPIQLDLYRPESGKDNNYVTLGLPGQDLKGNATVSVEGQRVDIVDAEEFTKFLDASVRQKTVMIAAIGETKAKIGALNADITLDKQIEIPALNNFEGFGIESAKILLPPADDGALMAGVLYIPNASPVSIGMGNLTLNVIVGGYNIGLARLYEVVLEPGDNTFDARIDADLGALMDNLGAILETQSEPLQRGAISLTATGNSTVFNGQNIKYYEDVLNNFELNTELPIADVITDSVTGLLGDSSGLLDTIMSALNSTGIGDILGNGGLDIGNIVATKKAELKAAS